MATIEDRLTLAWVDDSDVTFDRLCSLAQVSPNSISYLVCWWDFEPGEVAAAVKTNWRARVLVTRMMLENPDAILWMS